MDWQAATRRRYLLGLGTVGAAGLAGCLADDGETVADGGDDETPADTPMDSMQPDFGGYLDGATNYDGTVVNARGQADVTVYVGAGDSVLAFDPAAVHIDNGATVTWEWTGEGGAHNVVAEDGSFESGETKTSGTYRHTFENDGIYNYFCVPHKATGMLGAVVVGTDYPTVDESEESAPPAADYLANANNYDGYMNARGSRRVVVDVGAESGLAFGPPAVHVDTGTTVVWEWTGQGGAHNVVAEDGSVESGGVVSEAGTTFEYTFEESGLTRYHCVPHTGSGMKGAVLVGGEPLATYNGTYDPRSGGGPGAYPQPDFGGYLDDANNYDSEVVNRTGQTPVTVAVGGGDSGFAFGPAAVHVDLGATVRWEWTGEGGAHTVVAEDGTFDSGEALAEVGTEFRHTFDRQGIYTYYCEPHEAAGMKGAIVVGTDYPTE